jgi:hypothetical protein
MDPKQFVQLLAPLIPELIRRLEGDPYAQELLRLALDLAQKSPQEGGEAWVTMLRELPPRLCRILPEPLCSTVKTVAELVPALVQHMTAKGIPVVYETSELEHPPELV